MQRCGLVTGASSGIGLETARGLSRTLDVVGIVGRNAERLAGAKAQIEADGGAVVVFQADFSSLAEVLRLAEKVAESFTALQVLVNNAGVWHKERTLSRDGYEDTFAVNHLAHFLLTTSLKEQLACAEAARVVNVSSSMHRRPRGLDFDDLMMEQNWRGIRAYQRSKLANVLFSNELARRWASLGVTSNAVHPGNVRSRITRDNALVQWLHQTRLARVFILDEAQGAKTSIHVATAPELVGVTGRYFKECKEVAPSKAALDEAAAARLWSVSETLTFQR